MSVDIPRTFFWTRTFLSGSLKILGTLVYWKSNQKNVTVRREGKRSQTSVWFLIILMILIKKNHHHFLLIIFIFVSSNPSIIIFFCSTFFTFPFETFLIPDLKECPVKIKRIQNFIFFYISFQFFLLLILVVYEMRKRWM